MERAPIKLILTDIDNTILPREALRVSARTVAAFHAALDAGLRIGPSSGRGRSWIAPFFGGDEACCATAIASNGMQIYLDGVQVLERTLPRAALERMRAVVTTIPHAGLICFDGGTPLVLEGDRADVAVTFPQYANMGRLVDELPSGPVVKANVFTGGTEEDAAALAARLNEEVPELFVDRALPRFSNVTLRGWNKGAAVTWLCERLGMSLDEVVVFGDADNDLPMFKVVPNSVAVGNATPPAAAAARWHIGRCEDDAVAAAVEALAAGAWPFER